jgi:hypothetical protein
VVVSIKQELTTGDPSQRPVASKNSSLGGKESTIGVGRNTNNKPRMMNNLFPSIETFHTRFVQNISIHPVQKLRV